jgi:hypothetical protein
MASHPSAPFDPTLWLRSFAEIGGGYALTSARKLCFLVSDCDAEDLTGCMAQIIGQPDRQEALRRAIELRQLGQTA